MSVDVRGLSFTPPIPPAAAVEPDWRAMALGLRDRILLLTEELTMDCSSFTSLTGMKVQHIELAYTERMWRNPITKQWQRIVEYTLNPIIRLPKRPGEP